MNISLIKNLNPVICQFMMQLGRFDRLGSGVRNIHKYLPYYTKGASPLFEEVERGFRLTIPLKRTSEVDTKAQTHSKDAGQVTGQVQCLLQAIQGEQSRKELMSLLKLTRRDNFEKLYLKPALLQNLFEMTIPDKPNSRMQKYRLTDLGRKKLEGDK